MSRWDMGYRLARALGKDPGVLRKASREDVPAAEPRPRDTSLNSTQWDQRFPEIPRWDYEESLRQLGVTGSPA